MPETSLSQPGRQELHSGGQQTDFSMLKQWSTERAQLIHGANVGAHSPSQ